MDAKEQVIPQAKEFPEITNENVSAIEDYYLWKRLHSLCENKAFDNINDNLKIRLAIIGINIDKHDLRGTLSLLEMNNAMSGQTYKMKEKIKSGEITPIEPNDPRAAEHLVLGKLAKQIKDYWKKDKQVTEDL